jgi:hypothetical protein
MRRMRAFDLFRGLAAMVVVVACSHKEDPPAPWIPPPVPTWGDLPNSDEEARALVAREALPSHGVRFDASTLALIHADASKLVAGEEAIASAWDWWLGSDAKKPSYLLFGTLHDSREQIETIVAILMRMREPWGLALEQFRARGQWHGAPETPSADDADLAALGRRLDDPALFRIRQRQMELDHAAWKFDYVPALLNLLYAARGAGLPILGCDMPAELRAVLTSAHVASSTEGAMRELHCARALRSASRAFATSHAPDGGLTEDDPAPPERFAIILGADHAEPFGLPRFLPKNARWLGVQVLGGRPADAGGDETDLAPHLAVLDLVLLRETGVDVLLLPGGTWGGHVDRTSDHDQAVLPAAVAGLPRSNVMAVSDEPARFAVGESSVDVGPKTEWIRARAGHEAYVLVSPACTLVGAVDVPPAGYAELHFTPKDRAVRIVIHSP